MPTRTPGGVARVDYGKKLEDVMDDFDKAMEPGMMFSRGGSLNAADAAQYSDGGVMFSRSYSPAGLTARNTGLVALINAFPGTKRWNFQKI